MKSSRTRFLLAFFAAELLLAGISIPRVHLRNERAWRTHTDQLLRDKVVILARSVNSTNLVASSVREAELQAERHQLVWSIFDADRRQVRHGGTVAGTIPLAAVAHTNLSREIVPSLRTLDDPTLGHVRAAVVPVLAGAGDNLSTAAFAQVALPLKEYEEAAISRLGSIALGALVFSVLMVGAAAWLSNRWLASVRSMAESARLLGGQDLPRQRLPVPEKEPELAEFARVCNEMLDRIESACATRQQFIADAAHQLRTPLTILRGEIDVALRRDRDPERYRHVLNSNREEIERLCHLLESLLLLARVDAGKALGRGELLSLSGLCGRVVERFQPIAERQRVSLACAAQDGVSARGDFTALEHILNNLVQNALDHTPPGESISVNAFHEKNGAVLQVSDTGRGIPAEALPKLFQRFSRVEPNASSKPGGAGLGLAIVRSLAEAHGGRVGVQSTLGQGSTFSVWLPAAPDGTTNPPSNPPSEKETELSR